MASYKVLARLQLGHTGGVAAVAFSPSGTYLATAGLDSKVCVWTLSNQKLYHIFGGSKPVLSLAWIPSRDDTLICGSQDGAICVLRVSPLGQEARRFWAHKFPVEHLAVRDAYLAAGAQQELTIWKCEKNGRAWRRVLDLPEPPKTSHNEHHEVLVTSIHWTSTNSHRSILLVTYMHHGVLMYNTTDWTLIRTFPMNGCVANASVTADGTRMAVSNLTGFDIFALETMEPEGSLSHKIGDIYPVPVLFVHGGTAILGGSTVGEVELWNVTTRRKHIPLRLRGMCYIGFSWHGSCASRDYAHYDAIHDRFFIATGITKPDTDVAAVIWSDTDHQPSTPKRWNSRYYMVLAFVAIAALAVVLKGDMGYITWNVVTATFAGNILRGELGAEGASRDWFAREAKASGVEPTGAR